jgi:4-diphosphocytidyl-2-C-methyl-D-erythritol kinase
LSARLVERAPAKVNLTLRVLGRRPDGYHELESLVAFAGLADRLTLSPDGRDTLDVSGPFASACGPEAGNLVLKAMCALRERVGELKGGRFALEKHVPVAAGLGGGSSDAAAALRLLARVNGLTPDDPRLAEAAVATGADVPVCLDPRARIMSGVGERLSPVISLPSLPAILVNPRVPLSTREVFAALSCAPSEEGPLGEVPTAPDALFGYMEKHGNDLTAAAVACAPVVGEVLETLRALPGARLVRMSGSGPTCFALFASPEAASAAAARLTADRKDWWVHATCFG